MSNKTTINLSRSELVGSYEKNIGKLFKIGSTIKDEKAVESIKSIMRDMMFQLSKIEGWQEEIDESERTDAIDTVSGACDQLEEMYKGCNGK